MENTVMEVQILQHESESKQQITKTDFAKKKVREAQAILRDELHKDREFDQLDRDAKEMTKRVEQKRTKLMQADQYLQGLESKINELKSDARDEQITLDIYLMQYVEKNGKYTIKGEDGKVRRISKRLVVKKDE